MLNWNLILFSAIPIVRWKCNSPCHLSDIQRSSRWPEAAVINRIKQVFDLCNLTILIVNIWITTTVPAFWIIYSFYWQCQFKHTKFRFQRFFSNWCANMAVRKNVPRQITMHFCLYQCSTQPQDMDDILKLRMIGYWQRHGECDSLSIWRIKFKNGRLNWYPPDR